MRPAGVVFSIAIAAALGPAPARRGCDPALMYQIVKAALLEHEPATAAEFDRIMSKLGPAKNQNVWECETEEGTFLAVFVGAKRWVQLDYTPKKAEKIPD